jgi:hypothetical protein
MTTSSPCFSIITFDAKDPWETLQQHAKPELDQHGLKRLGHVLKDKCRSVVVERHYIDKDYRDTFSNYHSKRFNTPNARCVRLHFFSAPVTENDIVTTSSNAKESYLGYSVIRPTKPNCIGRTLLSHKLRLHPKAHITCCEEQANVLGGDFTINGFPFISQDTDATVCAESALWMVLRYFSNRYGMYSEVLPFQITNIASHHAVGRRVFPSGGLYSWQLAEALRLQRFSPVIYAKKAMQYQANFHHLLYTYIESGFPLLLTFSDHVIVGYGHASDYGAPKPAAMTPASRAYTSHFNRSLVVSDDNCFPYQMLHQAGPGNPIDSEYDWSAIEEFIVPLPEKVFLPAEQAQTAIEKVLRDFQPQSATLAGKPLLLRLFLTSARSFRRMLASRGMGHPSVQSIYRNLPLPHFVWVCEIADYDEYAADRRILGEVIWDATRNAHEPDGLIALHLPEKLIYDEGSAFNGPQSLKTLDLTGQKSYLLLVSNLHTL